MLLAKCTPLLGLLEGSCPLCPLVPPVLAKKKTAQPGSVTTIPDLQHCDNGLCFHAKTEYNASVSVPQAIGRGGVALPVAYLM